jgi:hypothetical protein
VVRTQPSRSDDFQNDVKRNYYFPQFYKVDHDLTFQVGEHATLGFGKPFDYGLA